MSLDAIQPTDGITRAKDFVNANPNRVAHKAFRHYQADNQENEKKFNKRINLAINSLPVVAAASTLALGKGAKSAAKSGAMWGVALAAPALISGINTLATKSSRSVKKAEKKHQCITLIGLIGASIATMEAGFRGVEKLAQNTTVRNAADTLVDGAKNTFKNLRSKVSGVNKFAEKGASVMKSVAEHTPKFMKGNAAKKVVGMAPVIIGFTALGAIVAHGLGEARKMSAIRADVKANQLNTAKELINVYDEENQNLKAENDILKSQLSEKAEPVEVDAE
mgnify:CR=1 FL=1